MPPHGDRVLEIIHPMYQIRPFLQQWSFNQIVLEIKLLKDNFFLTSNNGGYQQLDQGRNEEGSHTIDEEDVSR
jgi:hypothetical protein